MHNFSELTYNEMMLTDGGGIIRCIGHIVIDIICFLYF